MGFTVSGGARMQEGTTSLMQMAKVVLGRAPLLRQRRPVRVRADRPHLRRRHGELRHARRRRPWPSRGLSSAFAGPRVIEQTIHRKLPAGFQSAEFQLEHGFVDQIVARPQLRDYVARLLALHAPTATAAPAQTGAPCTCGEASAATRPADEANNPEATSASTQADACAQAAADAQAGGDAPSAYDRVRNARSVKGAPRPLRYIDKVFDEFVELHGDRRFADDRRRGGRHRPA